MTCVSLTAALFVSSVREPRSAEPARKREPNVPAADCDRWVANP